MKMNRSKIVSVLTPLIFALLAEASYCAPNYEASWSVVAGGGGTSASGQYTLQGTIGQPAASLSSGGTYSLASGFWGQVVQTPGAPRLKITRSDKNVILSWPTAATGFTLQSTADLSAKMVTWAAVPQSVSLV